MKQSNELSYFYAEPGSDVYGPLPLETLRTAQAAGKLSSGVLVSRQQTGPWAELATFNPPLAPLKTKAPQARDHPNYVAYSAACVLLPILGTLLGIVGMLRPEPLERKLGEHALALSIVLMMLYYFAYQMWWLDHHLPVR